MTFEEILDHTIAMLQRRGRLTYGTLKRQFQLDDAALEDLKNELIEGQRLAVDERGNVLAWTGAVGPASLAPSPSATAQEHAPLADEFLQALLSNDPSLAPLKRLVSERTEGNPFFLEESVQTLVETGVLVEEPGAYRLAQAVPTIQVPATMHAVLAARIDRLPADDKRLLQSAAVIGTEVPVSLLQAITALPDAALYRSLARLQAAELLYETRLFPEREYTFKHALTHEVTYGGLLHERKRTLHARIMEALEPLAADQQAGAAERLAYHALQGEVWDKALVHVRNAGILSTTSSSSVHLGWGRRGWRAG